MNNESMAALRVALESDEELRARFAAATTEAEVLALAEEVGVALDQSTEPGSLSDAELATVSGGYTFPATDWVYCDNPWTNYWCTLKC